MNGGMAVWVGIGLVVLIAIAVILFLASKRANSGRGPAVPGRADAPLSPTPTGTPDAPDAWSDAMKDAGAARPEAVDQPRTFFSRDSLIAPDRELDPSRWDNRPDGTEEYEEGAAPRGGGSIDAGFIQSLRERDKKD